jgi:putative transposase
MRSEGLRGLQRRRFRVVAGVSARSQAAPNRLERRFEPGEPNRIWASDLTYLPTAEGWLFLAVVLDVGTRRIVGWSMSAVPDTRLTINALDMAAGARHPRAGLLHHSDQGSQYMARAYQDRLDQYGFLSSMSATGDCWDNAVVESFFNTLKLELLHDRRQFSTRNEARRAVFDFIEVWYNRQRLHSSLGYLSPVSYEARAA